MSIMNPGPGEPGYTIKKLREAETDEEFVEAYSSHKKELEKHNYTVRPFDALGSRVIEHFGQYRMGESGEDERREDALWLLREFQRYLALATSETQGINGAGSVKRRTLAEVDADVAHVALSVLGPERSNLAFGEAFPAERATPTARRLVAGVDLGCTEMDDHDPPPCPKCEGIREAIGKVIDSALAEQDALECQSRNAGHVLHTFSSSTTDEDLEKMAADGIKRGAKAELELRRRRSERAKAKQVDNPFERPNE
jgi:hypothetical protein